MAWAEKPDGSWARTLVHDFGAPVWRVSWSVTGEAFALSGLTAPPQVGLRPLADGASLWGLLGSVSGLRNDGAALQLT